MLRQEKEYITVLLQHTMEKIPIQKKDFINQCKVEQERMMKENEKSCKAGSTLSLQLS